MKITLAAIATGLTLLSGVAHANKTSLLLYDGSSGNGNIPPEQQGWLVFGGVAISRNTKEGMTHLSTNRSSLAGYSNYQFNVQSLVNSSFPTLERNRGYTIRFDVKLNEENHQNSDKFPVYWR